METRTSSASSLPTDKEPRDATSQEHAGIRRNARARPVVLGRSRLPLEGLLPPLIYPPRLPSVDGAFSFLFETMQ